MGREVRRVPKDWQHPKGKSLFRVQDVSKLQAEWDFARDQWNRGLTDDWNGGWKPHTYTEPYEDYAGRRPCEEDYMPQWSDDQCTHYQMYETTSEGSPISPVMETAEALAQWLADNGASIFGYSTATYETWLRIIVGEAVIVPLSSDGRIVTTT